MRIVGGEYRGRRLIAPEGAKTRPTTDRLRERIFNIIEHGNGPRLAGARVADVFAGTGAMGLEALSRGAAGAVFIEKHRAGVDALERNIESLPVGDRAEILRADVRNLPDATQPYNIVFMDPPYGHDLEYTALQSLQVGGWLSEKTLIVLELPRDHKFDLDGFFIRDRRSQGVSEILFLGTDPAG